MTLAVKPVWIEVRDAFTLHDRLLALHGGVMHLRDDTLLKSVLAWLQQLYAYADMPSIVGMAAAYAVGIVRSHPFIDGNKRTGFVVGILFLELNGYRFTASEEEVAQAVLKRAGGTLDEGGYAAFLRGNVKEE